MKCRACIFGLVSVLFLLLTTGCQSLFLSKDSATVSAWTNWNQVTIAFNKINPNHTTVKELNNMGFNPLTTPNIKIMPYVDIIPVFMPNPNIHYRDLPIGVKLYVE